MEVLREWIINIITIVTIASFTEILMPNGSFRKYSQLVAGVVIMILLLKPFELLFDIDKVLDRYMLSAETSIYKTNIIKQSRLIEEKQNRQIVDNMETKMISHIKQSIKSVNDKFNSSIKIDIDKNIDSSGFGSLRRMEIKLTPIEGRIGRSRVKRVREVDLSQDLTLDNKINELEENKDYKVAKTRIIDVLHEVYNVPKENIMIYIQR